MNLFLFEDDDDMMYLLKKANSLSFERTKNIIYGIKL